MMLNLMVTLLPALSAVPGLPSGAPPVQISINNDRTFRVGDPVQVRVETGQGGYLLVLQYTPDGHVRVLFPVSPQDDASVQGDHHYEIRDASQAQSFLAAGRGPGLIYAALAEDPFLFDAVSVQGEWDPASLNIPRDTKDPEADLSALVQRLVSSKGFDYDMLDYVVVGTVAGGGTSIEVPSWWSPSYVGMGAWGDCFGCGYWGPGGFVVGVNIGWGWGWGGYYPWYYGGWPCCGYGYPGYGWGYYPYYPYYPGGGYYPAYGGAVIHGRPRGYNVIPVGNQPRPHDPGAWGTSRGPSGAGMPAQPPARRARPAGERGGGGQPSAGGQSGSGNRGGGQAKPQSGGQGGRARPRGGRPPGGDLQIAGGPTVETARPDGRAQNGWVRVGELAPVARPREGLVRNEAFIGRARAIGTQQVTRTELGAAMSSLPPARRATPVHASAPRGWSQAVRGGGEGARAARPSWGGGGGQISRPSHSGGSGAGSRPSSSGGGGRARGRP